MTGWVLNVNKCHVINAVVILIEAHDYNCTKSGVEISNISKTTIYLGLVLLTLVFIERFGIQITASC